MQFRRAQRLVNCNPHGVELVIARHFFLKSTAAVVIENDEFAHERQKTARFEYTFQHHLKLGQELIGHRLSRNRLPWLKPFLARRQRA